MVLRRLTLPFSSATWLAGWEAHCGWLHFLEAWACIRLEYHLTGIATFCSLSAASLLHCAWVFWWYSYILPLLRCDVILEYLISRWWCDASFTNFVVVHFWPPFSLVTFYRYCFNTVEKWLSHSLPIIWQFYAMRTIAHLLMTPLFCSTFCSIPTYISDTIHLFWKYSIPCSVTDDDWNGGMMNSFCWYLSVMIRYGDGNQYGIWPFFLPLCCLPFVLFYSRWWWWRNLFDLRLYASYQPF